jgi:hypothetical protein
MKRGIIIFILTLLLFAMLGYIWLTQSGDTMLMKHWIELIMMEAFIQAILILLTGKRSGV